MTALYVYVLVLVCAVLIVPVWSITSVLAWDVEVCGQTCRLGASVRSTLLNDSSESITLLHPSRSDVAIDLTIRPLYKRVNLFFKFHRNFSNLYEAYSDELNCMYSNNEVACNVRYISI